MSGSLDVLPDGSIGYDANGMHWIKRAGAWVPYASQAAGDEQPEQPRPPVNPDDDATGEFSLMVGGDEYPIYVYPTTGQFSADIWCAALLPPPHSERYGDTKREAIDKLAIAIGAWRERKAMLAQESSNMAVALGNPADGPALVEVTADGKVARVGPIDLIEMQRIVAGQTAEIARLSEDLLATANLVERLMRRVAMLDPAAASKPAASDSDPGAAIARAIAVKPERNWP